MEIRMLRLPAVLDRSGNKRSTLYQLVKDGLYPPPVKIGSGERAAAWIGHEIDAVNRARAAGWDDDRLRALVIQLVAERAALAPALRENQQVAAAA